MIPINDIQSVLGLTSPLGVPSADGLYLIVYPSSQPNTDTVYNIVYKCSGTQGTNTLNLRLKQIGEKPTCGSWLSLQTNKDIICNATYSNVGIKDSLDYHYLKTQDRC